MADKWKLHRAGILNFWYYDEQIFEFSDGKLLLRGSNGSGKSVTMQSFLPVLLDGKKTPDRLDPFGSRSRRMEEYLLGEKEVSNLDERTGYLFLEYKKENTEQYMTTGMGMQAKRNQPLKSWGFVITDNRRIGHELELFKWVTSDGEKKKFPRSKIELETVIGEGGEVAGSNKEYMALVNKYIFGFETMEAYEDLIKLLIQLRSPKLSKEFKPTVIYEILEEALPPLTDDDLRHLSESIEQMEQTRAQMEQLDREVSALRKLNDAYKQYNNQVLHEQISSFKQTEQTLKKETTLYKQHQSGLEKLNEQIATLTDKKALLINEEVVFSEAVERLKHHEIFKLEEERQKLQLAKEKLMVTQGEVDQKIENKSEKERRAQQNLLTITNQQHEQVKKLKSIGEELDILAEESAFANHEQNLTEWEKQKEEAVSFELWKTEIKNHTTRLNDALNVLKDYEFRLELFREKDRELGESERVRDGIQLEKKKWQDLFEEEKQKLLAEVHAWNGELPSYDIDSHVMSEIARLIERLFEGHDYEDIKAKLEPYAQAFKQNLQTEVAKIQGNASLANEKLEQLTQEYQEMKKQKDPEPERHEATRQFREQLVEKKITHAPLYQLIDFKENVSDDVKKRIESALVDMGLIDALVTTKDIDLKHDRLIQAKPVFFTQTLADFLKPDGAQQVIPVGRIEEILQSIEMNEDSVVYVTPEGTYQAGAITGHARPYDEVHFIGQEARTRYRLQLLRDLENKMLQVEEELSRLKKIEEQLNQEINHAEEKWFKFPRSSDAKTCYDELSKITQKEEMQNEVVQQLALQVRTLDQQLQALKRNLNDMTNGLPLKQSVTVYETALTSGRDYIYQLEEFHRSHQISYQLINEEKREKEIFQELQQEVDELKGELNVVQDDLDQTSQSIVQIEQEMKLKGMEDVQKEIAHNTKRLSEVREELQQVSDQLPRDETTGLQLQEQLKMQEKTVDFWAKMNESWRESLTKEWQLNGHTDDVFASVDLHTTFDTKKTKTVLSQRLNSLYYELQNDLIDHKMSNFTENVPLESWMKDIDAQWQPFIEQWRMQSTRLTVEFDQRGIKLSPRTLYHEILQEWEHQENRLNEMDKNLYEEILLHSVGNTLRARIRRAEIWTNKMKKIMEEGDISSGITFSIRWRPITAQTELELDTKDLVDLLKQDASLLSDADIEKITNHFRSKIKTARQDLLLTGEGNTLLQALKQALDYRKWFSFVLYYERNNEPRRELTNHQFFKFSGGEKALAMYIPLLTACYSRYQEAANHAPYIITLDEAFAGVDENNIQTMFKIVEQLGFNYMMNSQILWGDYETVSALTVSELLRPKNADFVTVIDYHWNGKKLERVDDQNGR